MGQQNKLFDEFYETGLKNAPERATSFGDYRYNALLGQYSLAEIARQHAEADDFLKRLKAIPTDGMGDNDLLSHRLLERQIEREDINYSLKNYEMPVNQQNGVHTRLADLPLSVPFDSVQHYQDYISRLHQIPRVLDQTTEVMRQGLKDGLMPPKLVLEKLPGQCDGIIAANPFLLPTKEVSGGLFGRGQEAADRRDHEGGQRRCRSRLQEVRGIPAHRLRPERTERALDRKPAGRQAALRGSREDDDHHERHARRGA